MILNLQAPPSDPAGDKSIEFTIQQEESEFVEFAEPEEEEEEEEEIPISLLKILRLNSKDWWLLGLGFVGAFIVGCVFPTFAIVFGEVLRVFSLPASQVLSEIHPWGATFLGLGVAAAVGLFMQVEQHTHHFKQTPDCCFPVCFRMHAFPFRERT